MKTPLGHFLREFFALEIDKLLFSVARYAVIARSEATWQSPKDLDTHVIATVFERI